MAGKKKAYIDSEGIYHSPVKGNYNLVEISEYYRTHTRWETAQEFNISERYLRALMELYNFKKSPEETKAQIEKGFLRKYGVKRPFQSSLIQQKVSESVYNSYGVENVGQIDWVKDKIKETSMNRYGVRCNLMLEYVKEKANDEAAHKKARETMHKNNSFAKSKPEEILFDKLCNIYGAEDVFRQYSDERYPFACDFYIKSEDLFIELNAHWTHGGHEFNENDPNDIEKLNKWKSKANTKKFYKQAIYVWTILDKKKIAIARNNNLNYIRIYKYNYKEEMFYE